MGEISQRALDNFSPDTTSPKLTDFTVNNNFDFDRIRLTMIFNEPILRHQAKIDPTGLILQKAANSTGADALRLEGGSQVEVLLDGLVVRVLMTAADSNKV